MDIPKFPFEIDHKDSIVSMGSCFSDHIGSKLDELWFDILTNPFGVMFNPISIANLIERALEEKFFTETDIQQRKDIYFLFETHGKLADTSAEKVLDNANSALKKLKTQLEKAHILILTFGTSFYFELKEEEKVVGNCHKMPQSLFDRKKVKSDQIVKIYDELLDEIRGINPNIQVVFTVSPIRHTRDGLVANNRSKAELLIACEQLENHAFCHYFPSYEIQLDVLRDYRFYSRDLNHPSDQAIDLIFEEFSKVVFSEEKRKDLKEIQNIVSQEKHRSHFPESEESQLFQKKLLENKTALKGRILG